MPTRPMPLSVLGRHDGVGIEAAAVVTDLHADALEGLLAKEHGDLAATAVVPDVAQRLWRTRRSAIRWEAVSASKDPSSSTEVDTRPPAQRRELPFDGVRQRLLKERARFERVRQVAQVLMELGELRLEVGEPADDCFPVLARDEVDHLLAKQVNVLRECVHLLERAVVEVEAQAHEQPFVRRGQPASRASVVESGLMCEARLSRVGRQRSDDA